MRFQMTTDYAIRIVVYLAQADSKTIGAADAAKELGMTYGYFNKVATYLRNAGMIESIQGRCGGYRLIKDPAVITLYDIFRIIQGDLRINRCLDEDGFCSRFGQGNGQCSVHHALEALQDQIIDSLKSMHVCDFCAQNPLVPCMKAVP